MKFLQSAIAAVLILLTSAGVCLGQPLCYHHNSVDWMMIDTPVVVRVKLVDIKPIKDHPKLSEFHVEVLETFRGDVKGNLRIPVETEREIWWGKKFVHSQSELVLFLVRQPRGYSEPEVAKVIKSYDQPLYYFWRINLAQPKYVYNLKVERLTDSNEVLKSIRELAKKKIPQPRPSMFTFQLPNADSLTVPLNDRMEAIASDWAKSTDKIKRHHSGLITWGFKRQRNKPFESGYWYSKLKCPGGDIRFGLRLDHDDANKPYAFIINGTEAIRINDVVLEEDRIRINFPHYDSFITASLDRTKEKMTGKWRKLVGKDKWCELPFSSSTESDRKNTDYRELADIYGIWNAQFSKTDDSSVIEIDSSYLNDFLHKDVRQYWGTVLTTTGDYRYMAGDFIDGKLELSAFDGAHAFLLRAEYVEGQRLKGEFWSRDNWHETWTAKRGESNDLPDAFDQTRATDRPQLDDLQFPNLDGKLKSLTDEEFAGKVRIITVFGTWCPNCHDSATYLRYLHVVYGDKGLSIVGLAFELTGDFERDAKQVRRYVKRHNTPYPILLAGISDKEKASQTLPFLDRVRAYPTTIILNSKNEIIDIHTGFSGPATGQAYDDLKRKFEEIIVGQLEE